MNPKSFQTEEGFTLIELMVTVAIVVILSVIAGININSRINISNLEGAAQTMMADLSAARSSALLKGCPIRIMICQDAKCQTISSVGTVTTSSAKYLGSSGTPAQYYGIYRLSQNQDQTWPCYNSQAVAYTADAFNNWDFDRRPQMIPMGVVFSPIYNTASGAPDSSDWVNATDAGAPNAIWFSSNTGAVTENVQNATDANGNTIIMQLTLASCNPSSSTGNCVGYFITMGPGGGFNMVKCAAGGRTGNGNNCF